MTKTRLYAALSLALLVAPVTQAAKYRVVELPVIAEGKSSFPSAMRFCRLDPAYLVRQRHYRGSPGMLIESMG